MLMDFLKLLFPVFWSAKDYPDVLKRLASILFWETYVLTFVLRSNIPAINNVFESVEHLAPITKILAILHGENLNFCGFIISLLVAWIGYALRLHDRISDLFGVRKRFDRNYILLPLAILSGSQLSAFQLNRVDANRDSLMRRVFYQYASSRAEKPVVDKHDIEAALEIWSWYWVLVEGTAVLLAAGLVAAFFASYSLTNTLCWIAVAFWVAALLYSLRLPRFARPQVEQIAANAPARQAVREAFGAL
jgi:hypothetical protein